MPDRYFADVFDAEGRPYVFDTLANGAEVCGPFDTLEEAFQTARQMNDSTHTLIRYTVVGTYADSWERGTEFDAPQRYASYFWAEDTAHAEEQARDEAGDTLIVAGVLLGECPVMA